MYYAYFYFFMSNYCSLEGHLLLSDCFAVPQSAKASHGCKLHQPFGRFLTYLLKWMHELNIINLEAK